MKYVKGVPAFGGTPFAFRQHATVSQVGDVAKRHRVKLPAETRRLHESVGRGVGFGHPLNDPVGFG